MSRPAAAALFLALLGAGPPQAGGGCGDSYRVARGDTLYSIASRCRSSVAAIAAASGLADPRRIEIGQRLAMPGGAAPMPEQGEAGLAYRFAPGDTLYSLARWSRTGVRALIAANPGIDPHRIEIGDAVRLPAGAVPPGPARARERGRNSIHPLPLREMRREAPREAPPANEPDEESEREPEPEGM